VSAVQPATAGEVPVFPTDYGSVTEMAAQVGMQAMTTIRGRIPTMDNRDLVAVAKLGTAAAGQREALRLRAQEVDQSQAIVEAITGVASGLLDPRDIPEIEVIDITPVEGLVDEVAKERAALKRIAAGSAVGDAHG